MALTDDQKNRLNELKTKESLTEEEKTELAELESQNEPADPDKEFDDAWNDASDDDVDGSEGSEGADQKGTKKDPQAAAEGDTTDGQGIFVSGPDATSEGDPATGDGVTGDDQGAELKKLQEENARLIQKMKSWEGRITAANKRADEAEARIQGQAKSTNSDGSTLPDGDSAGADEAQSIINEFVQEFPDLEKPINTLIDKKVKERVDRIVEEKIKPVQTTVESITATVSDRETKEHLGKITAAHPDWEKIYKTGALKTWIDLQPSFIQNALNEIVKSGSTEEIIELFDQYKKSTGRVKPSQNAEGSQSKVNQLEAVHSTPTTPPRGGQKKDPNDFDAGWDDATRDEK